MISYQVDACKKGATGNLELVASLEFEAANTLQARAKADAWCIDKSVVSSGATLLRLHAGRAFISERTLTDQLWQDPPRG